MYTYRARMSPTRCYESNLNRSVHQAVDLASDFVWLCAVVETGPFADAVEYAYVNVIGWALFALNLARCDEMHHRTVFV